MMKKSKIDWCDFTWNPVTGCHNKCEYCYARNIARRFCGDISHSPNNSQIKFETVGSQPYCICTGEKPFKNLDGKTIPYPAGFIPTLHKYRLPMPAQKKKPANIFVCSMADLFESWIPDEWILKVFEACKAAPQHNYLFLTKNPTRYLALKSKGKLPQTSNMWYGITVTNKAQAATATFIIEELGAVEYRTFLSIEPILEDISEEFMDILLTWALDWVIIGAETGRRQGKVTPKINWIYNIVTMCAMQLTPVFIKDSKEIRAVVGSLVDCYRDFPEWLKRPLSAEGVNAILEWAENMNNITKIFDKGGGQNGQ